MEKCFLGSLLMGAEKGKAETRLKADDFDNKNHGRIFETILKQWNEGTTPTIITLYNALSPEIQASEIAELTSLVPSDANLTYYENQIFEASKTRNFIKALQRAKNEVDAHTDTDTVIKNLIPALAEVTTARNEAGIKTAAELLRASFPEICWIVPGLIGEGLTLICGAPKIGKSWFGLNLAIAATAGGGFLGTLKAEKTETLYMALEDTERRIHSRLKKLGAPETDNLKITTQWRDGYTGLEYYLKANSGIGLVIIDTLARFANIEDMNAYSMTTNAMARLKRIADDLNIAIILIHHAKKTGQQSSGGDWMESVLGSTGLTGATDSTIFITRNRTQKETKNTARLYATGRDSADIIYDLKLDLDCRGWAISNSPMPDSEDNQDESDPQGQPKKLITRDDINGNG
jgi:replicative DNA helicase